jgi:hypothetical protein
LSRNTDRVAILGFAFGLVSWSEVEDKKTRPEMVGFFHVMLLPDYMSAEL